MTMIFTVIRNFETIIREFDDVNSAVRCASALSRFDSDAAFGVINPEGVVVKVTYIEDKTTLIYSNGRTEVWDYKKK